MQTDLAKLLRGKGAAVTKRIQSLQAAANELLPALYANMPAVEPGKPAPETLAAGRVRLKKQFDTEYNGMPAAAGNAWIDSILTLETAAHLSAPCSLKAHGR